MNTLSPTPTRIAGLDYLRFGAVVLVVLQHQLSVIGLEHWTLIYSVSIGQTGVSLFLSISGVLAFQSTRPPWSWLSTRLVRIYPAFWIATAISFMAAAITGYKSFSATQVVSQLAGTGLFTHWGRLVNTATWFVSLLLVLYLIVFLVRLTTRQYLLAGLLASCSLLLIPLRIQPPVFAHAASFFLTPCLLRPGQQTATRFGIVAALLLFAIPCRPFAYPAVSILTTAAVLALPPAPAFVTLLSGYSYEFYLLHGIFLVGSQRYLGHFPQVSIPLGIASAMLAAVALRRSMLLLAGPHQAR